MIASLFWLLASWGGGEAGFYDLPANSSASANYNFEVIDRWPYGPGFSVLLDSNTLYYTNGAVLQIGEVDTQGKVFWLSELVFPGLAYTMAREGNRLYVAVDDQGVAIVDVSSADNSTQLNFFPAGGRVFGLAVRGDTLYVALGSGGLGVYDCRNLYNPEPLGKLAGYSIRSLELIDGFLYATDPDYGLRVIDVSEPIAPSIVSGINLTGQHYGLALDSLTHQAWVCSFYGGVHVVDISDPYYPALEATIPMGGAWSLDLMPEHAFVAAWDDSVHVINRENYTQLSAAGFDTIQIWPYSIDVQDNRVALAGFLGSWWMLDITDSLGLSVTDGQSRGGVTDEVISHERWLISGMQGSKIAFFPDDQALNPALLLRTEDWPRELEIRGDTLFVAEGWAGLSLYDISEPLEGVDLISRFTEEGIQVWEVELHSGYAYLACDDSGLLAVDLSDPLNPQRMWKLGFSTRVFSLSISGDTLYAGTQDRGIFLVNVADPNSPEVIASHLSSFPIADILLDDAFLYVAEGIHGVSVYDIHSPAWDLLSEIPSGHASLSLVLEGNILFIADGSAGIKAYDVQDPSLPHLVGSLNTGGEARGIVISSDTLTVADGYDGLARIRFLGLDIEESPLEMQSGIMAWPNPFTSRICFNQDVHADLYDSCGRWVSKISGKSFDARNLKQGVYFVKGQGWCIRLIKLPLP